MSQWARSSTGKFIPWRGTADLTKWMGSSPVCGRAIALYPGNRHDGALSDRLEAGLADTGTALYRVTCAAGW